MLDELVGRRTARLSRLHAHSLRALPAGVDATEAQGVHVLDLVSGARRQRVRSRCAEERQICA